MISVNYENRRINVGPSYIYHAMNFRENEHVIFFAYNGKDYLLKESEYKNLLEEADRITEGFLGQPMTPQIINAVHTVIDQLIRTRSVEDTYQQGRRLLNAKKTAIDEEEIYEMANEYFMRRFGRPIEDLEEWKMIQRCLGTFEEHKDECN